MLASVSNTQPVIYREQTPQHSFAHKKNNTESKNNKNTLEPESSKLTKKAVEELTKEEQAKVQQLKRRDLEVKAHEQAHLSAAGSLSHGGASFTYTTGPNGIRYATGGEVSISTSAVNGDPAATIRKADAIRRAALSPATPSSQDQAVANRATAMAETAREDLIKLTQEEQKSEKESKKIADTEENELKNNNGIDNASSSPESLKGSLIDLSA